MTFISSHFRSDCARLCIAPPYKAVIAPTIARRANRAPENHPWAVHHHATESSEMADFNNDDLEAQQGVSCRLDPLRLREWGSLLP